MSKGVLKVGFWWATVNGAVATVLFVVWSCCMPWLSNEINVVTQIVTTASLGMIGAINVGLAIGLECGVRVAEELQEQIDYLSNIRDHLYEELRSNNGYNTGTDEDSDSCEVDDSEGHA